ncbi:hypothetical protein LV779_25885 [Streptomyces thinghirensis]|nr:hypothetical protein [Streptomyces thinghirensis]
MNVTHSRPRTTRTAALAGALAAVLLAGTACSTKADGGSTDDAADGVKAGPESATRPSSWAR